MAAKPATSTCGITIIHWTWVCLTIWNPKLPVKSHGESSERIMRRFHPTKTSGFSQQKANQLRGNWWTGPSAWRSLKNCFLGLGAEPRVVGARAGTKLTRLIFGKLWKGNIRKLLHSNCTRLEVAANIPGLWAKSP